MRREEEIIVVREEIREIRTKIGIKSKFRAKIREINS